MEKETHARFLFVLDLEFLRSAGVTHGSGFMLYFLGTHVSRRPRRGSWMHCVQILLVMQRTGLTTCIKISLEVFMQLKCIGYNL